MNTPSSMVSPGLWGFLAFFFLAVALYLLMRNMNARMRRMSYRQQAAHRGKNDPQAGDGDGPVERTAPVDEADGRMPEAGSSTDPPAGEGDTAPPGVDPR